ncbi:MAG: 2-dehydropantoate 2-reductase [Alphaproteobacteria bacterium]|nr:2-dehydropantoate 2-reductase [Alphaproteobacteria bacterium]
MRFCMFGAGAIGSYLGGELSLAGADVTLISRGLHHESMKKNGVRLRLGNNEKISFPQCFNDPNDAGIQDYVFITLKAHTSASVADSLLPLLGPKTTVVTAQNGVPWWYFYNLEGPWKNYQLKSVDPQKKQWEIIKPSRVIGSVIYPAAEIISPGIVGIKPHISQNRLPIGELDGNKSERVSKLSETLIKSGFKAPIRKDIRSDIWVKLWGNIAFNPISALTGQTLENIASDLGTQDIVKKMMLEAQIIAEKLGVRFNIDVDTRIAGAKAVGHHRTSMLQDLILGRPIEIDALLGAINEIGDLLEIHTPVIDTVYSLLKNRVKNSSTFQKMNP